jgi:hypothetical protein
MLLSSLLLLTFLLSDSGGPAAVDISDYKSVPAVVGLPACCCFTTFASIPAFAGVPFVLAVLFTFIPDVACISPVVGSHAFAAILAVAC